MMAGTLMSDTDHDGEARQKCRLLYVDDDPDIREIAAMALDLDGGFEVHTADCGAAAVEKARSSPPDIILLDVMMPGMDGPQTLQAMRDETDLSKAIVFFITARSRPAEIEHLLSLGAVAVIPKPFDPMTLATEVRSRLS